jgi:hypothetical protein
MALDFSPCYRRMHYVVQHVLMYIVAHVVNRQVCRQSVMERSQHISVAIAV